jgi:hypothetical protein
MPLIPTPSGSGGPSLPQSPCPLSPLPPGAGAPAIPNPQSTYGMMTESVWDGEQLNRASNTIFSQGI